jgi:hypothetical protein
MAPRKKPTGRGWQQVPPGGFGPREDGDRTFFQQLTAAPTARQVFSSLYSDLMQEIY